MRPFVIATVVVCLCGGPLGSESADPVVSIPSGLDRYLPAPSANPITGPKLALGRRLFSERRLSVDGRTACVSCHDPARAFTDGRRLPLGVHRRVGRRNVPSLLNRAYGTSFFWDGRAESLEDQVRMALAGSVDLGSSAAAAASRIAHDQGYAAAFQTAFGSSVSTDGLVEALATFVRGQLSGASAFDRFVAGDRAALSSAARAGFELFTGTARCARCHAGPLLSDEAFHNTGVSYGRDLGRFEVTGRPEDLGTFKTPSLRNVAITAPYMHDGSVATLEAVIDFYARGAGANPHLDDQIRPLVLSATERRALLAFLRSLTGSAYSSGLRKDF